MTIETLKFLNDLVNSQQISASNPDLVALATLVAKVKAELDEAIKEAQ